MRVSRILGLSAAAAALACLSLRLCDRSSDPRITANHSAESIAMRPVVTLVRDTSNNFFLLGLGRTFDAAGRRRNVCCAGRNHVSPTRRAGVTGTPGPLPVPGVLGTNVFTCTATSRWPLCQVSDKPGPTAAIQLARPPMSQHGAPPLSGLSALETKSECKAQIPRRLLQPLLRLSPTRRALPKLLRWWPHQFRPVPRRDAADRSDREWSSGEPTGPPVFVTKNAGQRENRRSALAGWPVIGGQHSPLPLLVGPLMQFKPSPGVQRSFWLMLTPDDPGTSANARPAFVTLTVAYSSRRGARWVRRKTTPCQIRSAAFATARTGRNWCGVTNAKFGSGRRVGDKRSNGCSSLRGDLQALALGIGFRARSAPDNGLVPMWRHRGPASWDCCRGARVCQEHLAIGPPAGACR